MITDVSLVVTAVGVLGAWFSLRQSYHDRLHQLESRYVDRYWKITEQLTLDALRATRQTPDHEVNVNPEDEKAIRSYIILCEDEIEQRANGYITDTTYSEWIEGIHQQFSNNPMFSKVWGDTKSELTFPYVYMEQLLGGTRRMIRCTCRGSRRSPAA